MSAANECESLEKCLPEGQVVDRAWLKARGFDRPRIDYYLRSGALETVTRGVYRKQGPPLKWEHIVYSLQELGCSVHVGGRSALELQGMAHFLPLQGMRILTLYSSQRLPAWLKKLDLPFSFEQHSPRLFKNMPEQAITTRPFGHWDWPIRHALPELALLEMLAEVRTEADFSFVDKFFESALMMRPQLIRELLLQCTNVKAKRLFLWFSERYEHPWKKVLDITGVSLGSGKRMIIKGGVLDKQYEITVPKGFAHGAEPFF
ncbi:MAG TPA: type IV toxin-antitoxin system AbiEi family antitoxin domain-containing protein [Dissulfurispiraceae bacterium]|nr:type IV toxin-antitoxin system AbiEi family antitoxin domain-containing protein [Dissulfurispiraceae bacterium]